MPNKRKQYSPQFKFDRALEAVKNDNLSEISRQYGISPNILSKWRSDLLAQGARMFQTAPNGENKQLKAKISKLEQMLGQKEIELNLLKNFSDFYESRNTT